MIDNSLQETLRHANFKVTMDVYTQSVTEVKRSAHNRVVSQIMGGASRDAEENQ